MDRPPHSLCEDCAGLNLTRLDFDQPPFIPEDKYHKVMRHGKVKQLKIYEHSCNLCSLILHTLHLNTNQEAAPLSDDAEWELEWQQNCFDYDPNDDDAEYLYGSGLYSKLKNGGGTTDYCIQLVEGIGNEQFLRGRMVMQMVNTEIIQRWIVMCKKQHGEQCKSDHFDFRKVPDRFLCIDVKDLCLRRIDADADTYTALSYVWGPNNSPRTTKATIQEFSKPGAFASVTLPQTIADAVELTKTLGYKFLWVDSLCIVQDADKEKLELIELMDVIYNNADVTIVAASGDTAQSGLSGWSSTIQQVSRHIRTATIGPNLRLGVLPFFDREMMDSSHASRGWT
jgi:Heterokaryon incompatibility protein (HET)